MGDSQQAHGLGCEELVERLLIIAFAAPFDQKALTIDYLPPLPEHPVRDEVRRCEVEIGPCFDLFEQRIAQVAGEPILEEVGIGPLQIGAYGPDPV